MRHDQEHEPPTGHEYQCGFRSEHAAEKNRTHDGDEAEPAAGSRDRCGGDPVLRTADAEAGAHGCHRDRDECQRQDLDRVGNGVPDKGQETDPGGEDQQRSRTGE